MKKFSCIEVFLLAFVSFSPLLSDVIRVFMILSILLVNIVYYRLNAYKVKFDYLFLIFVVIPIVYCIYNFILYNINFSIVNLYIPLCIVTGYISSIKYRLKDFLFNLDKTMYVLAICSLIGFLLILFFPQLIKYFFNYTYGDYTHKTAILFNVLFADGYLVKRNTGFAREPGVFQLLLCICLFYNIEYKKNIKIVKVAIYIISIITTFSTIGLILLIPILIHIFFKHPKARGVLIVFSIVFLNLLISIVSYQANNKLYGSSSFNLRYVPMLNAFNYSILHPLGIGTDQYNLLFESSNIGSYDSYSQFLLRFGFIEVIVLLVILFRLSKKKFLLCLILSVSFFAQFICYLPFVVALMFCKEIKNEDCLDSIQTSRLYI